MLKVNTPLSVPLAGTVWSNKNQHKPSYECVAAEWYVTEHDEIGFVLIKTRGNRYKCYFGVKTYKEESLAAKRIAQYGVRLENHIAKKMFINYANYEWAK